MLDQRQSPHGEWVRHGQRFAVWTLLTPGPALSAQQG